MPGGLARGALPTHLWWHVDKRDRIAYRPSVFVVPCGVNGPRTCVASTGATFVMRSSPSSNAGGNSRGRHDRLSGGLEFKRPRYKPLAASCAGLAAILQFAVLSMPVCRAFA